MDIAHPNINLLQIALLVAPILLIQLVLAVIALIDLSRRKFVRGPRGLWLGLLIVAIFSFPAGVIISGLYLVWGRNPEGQIGVDNDTD